MYQKILITNLRRNVKNKQTIPKKKRKPSVKYIVSSLVKSTTCTNTSSPRWGIQKLSLRLLRNGMPSILLPKRVSRRLMRRRISSPPKTSLPQRHWWGLSNPARTHWAPPKMLASALSSRLNTQHPLKSFQLSPTPNQIFKKEYEVIRSKYI